MRGVVVAFAMLVAAAPAHGIPVQPVQYEPTAVVTGSTIHMTFEHPVYRCAGERDPAAISVDLVGGVAHHAHATAGAGYQLSIPIDQIAIDCTNPRRWTATFDVLPWAQRANVPPGRYAMTVMWGPRTGYAFEAHTDVELGGGPLVPVLPPTRAIPAQAPPSADHTGIRWSSVVAFLALDAVVVAIVVVALRRRRARRAR